ncbi:succinate dehydrogenase/fumarate reductase flavoprotein subunit [Microterricola gilva]|uniref:3-oxosteroid 1-dehydrogenase n=1 Tax=Microterricola gilva TaxID=393267 RepID=A0A4Q8ANF6_9MICO|nr:3-ketosteroid-delta-1-dehydrogenase [Microterricola gilva]RZU66144.1 succinate dehydrogenase/fumarate reductase flavoprotein subunit [Microterricola gilva]
MTENMTIDLLVVGSGTGLAAALSAHEQGATVLVIEKTAFVGGSTARSGGAFWIPANPVLATEGADDTQEKAREYLSAVVDGTAPEARWESFLTHGSDTVRMLERTTRMQFTWAEGYSDYHPELPGGSASGRSCECRPFDVARLGAERARLRAAVMEAPVPMPVTGADYKWLNLLAKKPLRGFGVAFRRAVQGIGGKLIGREYAAGGRALAAGLFDGVVRAGIPVWTETSMQRLVLDDAGAVVGAVVTRGGQETTILAKRGVILAAGGFDHDLELRRSLQSTTLEGWSLGSDGNTGDAIRAAQAVGAGVALMDQAWWFPAIAPLAGEKPTVMLAERSLPGSFIVDATGSRFLNEAEDYMSFGHDVLEREREGRPVGTMWLIFDQAYRNSYLLGGATFPRMPLPTAWYEQGIAVRGSSWAQLAERMGVPAGALRESGQRFNELAAAGVDEDFGRGNSAYDRYYGDPTIAPNPNLRPLDPSGLYAIRLVLSDLGTCGGITADADGRALTADGSPIPGLYAIGNSAANVFGQSYPGAGATIGQGLVYGHIAARHAIAARVDAGR